MRSRKKWSIAWSKDGAHRTVAIVMELEQVPGCLYGKHMISQVESRHVTPISSISCILERRNENPKSSVGRSWMHVQ